jgi:hypothetical protein
MKSNGSIYVAVCCAVLFGYFGYQWWFNPARAVKHRLGEVAAALSVPEQESDLTRVTRMAQLRGYLGDDLRITIASIPDVVSRDMALAAAGAWRPPPGSGDVRFADVQVFIESDTTAHAYMAVQLTSVDLASGQPTIESRDASVGLAKRNGEWVVTTAEAKELPARR